MEATPPTPLPREAVVDLGDMRMHYLEWGDAAAPLLLLLHGGGQTARSWDYFAAAMAPHFRIVVPNQRGHGDSSWAVDGDYSGTAHLRDLSNLVERLNLQRFALVGLSLGGRNAMRLALDLPGRVQCLVIVDVGPDIDAEGATQIRAFMAGPDVLDTVDAFVERALAFNPRRSREGLRRSLLHNLRQSDDGRWTWKYDPRLRDPTRRPTGWGDLWTDLTQLRCPTLVIRGAESNVFTDAQATRLTATIPNAQRVTIANAGHTVPGDNPTEFAAVAGAFLLRHCRRNQA